MVLVKFVIHVKDTGTTRDGKPRLSDTPGLSKFVNEQYQRLMWELSPNISSWSVVIQNHKGSKSKRVQLESPDPKVMEVEVHEYVDGSNDIISDVLPTDALFDEEFMALYNA
jgi:hypothetical protein